MILNLFKKSFFIFALFNLGCSFISKKIEQNNTASIQIPNKFITKGICTNNENNQLIIKDSDSLNLFNSSKIKDFLIDKKINSVDKFIVLQLINFLKGPTSVSHQSRIQFFINLSNKSTYYEFFTSDKSNNFSTFFHSLDYISKKHRNKNIADLVSFVNLNIPEKILVNDALSSFLNKNIKVISENENLKNAFFKGDDILRKDESFKRINLLSEYSLYQKEIQTNKFINARENQLFISSDDNNIASCSFKLSDEKLTVDQINYENVVYDYIVYKDNEDFYLSTYSSLFNFRPQSSNLSSLNLLQQGPTIPLCHFFNKENKNSILLISPEGRDSSQHLKHLHDYGIYDSLSINHVLDFLKFPRHLFLNNPDRVLYESKLGRKEQLDFFLSLNFPIYHVENLGLITGVAKFSFNKKINLIKENRSQSGLLCY